MKQPRHLFRNIIAVVLTALGVLTVTATTAAAEQTCKTGVVNGFRYDLCLSIRPIGGDQYSVHIGLDYHVGRLNAEAIIDQPGDPADAWIMSDEPFTVITGFNVPLVDFGASDSGLHTDFDRTVPYAALDEDPGNDPDEVLARVRVFDNRTPATETFTTGILRSPFDPD